jgi:DNA primase
MEAGGGGGVAGRIRDEDVALVRDRTSIADIISEYVTLKPAGGGNVKGLCPFHDEKTPSFNVATSKGVYYCYGCGAGGDAIRFVMTLEHLSFVEAVERLAAKAGVQVQYAEAGPAMTRAPQGQRQRLVAANAAAAEFYTGQLGGAGAQPGSSWPSAASTRTPPRPTAAASPPTRGTR